MNLLLHVPREKESVVTGRVEKLVATVCAGIAAPTAQSGCFDMAPKIKSKYGRPSSQEKFRQQTAATEQAAGDPSIPDLAQKIVSGVKTKATQV